MKSKLDKDEIVELLKFYQTICHTIAICCEDPLVVNGIGACGMVQFHSFVVKHQTDNVKTDKNWQSCELLRYFTSIAGKLDSNLNNRTWKNTYENLAYSKNDYVNKLTFIETLQTRFQAKTVTDHIVCDFLAFLKHMMKAARGEFDKMDVERQMQEEQWWSIKIGKSCNADDHVYVPDMMRILLRLYCLSDWYKIVEENGRHNTITVQVPTIQLCQKVEAMCNTSDSFTVSIDASCVVPG